MPVTGIAEIRFWNLCQAVGGGREKSMNSEGGPKIIAFRGEYRFITKNKGSNR